jgi:hypothetical protein
MLHYPLFRTSLLVSHELEQPFELGTGITATFVDANHCTGTVLVVFEGGGLRDGPVANSGDFRFCEALLGSPACRSGGRWETLPTTESRRLMGAH